MDLNPQSIPVGPRLMAVLEVAFRARQPALLEGPTGIGKSEMVAQLADRLGADHVVLDLSLLEPPDLVGMPVVDEGRTTYAAPEILPTGGRGILMLEELNRAERYIQQPALQLLTARRLHQYELPEGWSTMAAINPEDGEYQVTPLDPALRSRFMNLRVHAHRASWLAWAGAHEIHPVVLELARLHDRIFEIVPPRTWTYVSDALHTLSPAEVQDPHLLRDTLGGFLPEAWLVVLLKQRDDGALSAGLDARVLVRDYHRDEGLRSELDHLSRDGRLDLLEQTAHHLQSIVRGPELGVLLGRGEFEIQAFEAVLGDLPGDLREDLGRAFGDNPLAVVSFDLDVPRLLNGYSGSPASRRVGRWLRDRPHRVRATISALTAHIGRIPDLNQRRRNNGFRLSLGVLLEQVGLELGEPLAVELYRLGVEPLFPGKR